MKKGDIVICTKFKVDPNTTHHHSEFTIGNKYTILTCLNFFVYVLNNNNVSVRYYHEEINKYFISVDDWREKQLNKLL